MNGLDILVIPESVFSNALHALRNNNICIMTGITVKVVTHDDPVRIIVFKPGSIRKRRTRHGKFLIFAESHVCKGGAVPESISAQVFHAVWQGNKVQTATALKSAAFYRGKAIRELDIFKPVAVLESVTHYFLKLCGKGD